MIDLTNYKFLDFANFFEDIFDYFKDNSVHYGLKPNQVVGNTNEKPIGGLVIDIYFSEYDAEQVEQPTPFFLDTTTITIELILLGISNSTATKSYAELCDRTARLSAVASEIDDYLCSKGYDVYISSVNTFQAVRDPMKSSDTLNNGCTINLATTLYRKI